MTWEIRQVATEDEQRKAWELGTLAFGGDRSVPHVWPDEDPARSLALWDGDDLVAKAKIRPYEQYFGGRAVPMGGIASVAVAPESRGTGAAQHLLTHTLGVMREDGHAVSALYPSAVGLYRSLGWELAGVWTRCTVRTIDLARVRGGEDVTFRRCSPADIPAVEAIYTSFAGERSGMLTRTGPAFPDGAKDILDFDGVPLAIRGGEVVGYASFARGRGYMTEARIDTWDVIGVDADATAALLRHLSTWSAVAPHTTLRWVSDDVASLVAMDSLPAPSEQRRWMLRIIDAPAAIDARGFRSSVSARVELELRDERAEWNSGRFVLEVADGRGTLSPGGSGSVQCDIRALAALYACAYSASTLLRTPNLSASPREIDALDACFAGQPSVMWDYF